MKKLIAIIVAMVLIMTPMVATQAYVGTWAEDACNQAAASGWNHPGMVNACLEYIINDIITGGGWED